MGWGLLRDGLLVAAGGVLLLVTVLTESGERSLQAWLERTWVRADDASVRAIRGHVAFMRNVFRTCGAILDGVFGTRLVSRRAVAVSATVGVAMFLMFAWPWLFLVWPMLGDAPISIPYPMRDLQYPEVHFVVLTKHSVNVFLGFLLFVFAILPPLLKPLGVRVWGVLMLLFWVYAFWGVAAQQRDGSEVSPFFIALIIGFACDVVLIVAARRLFRAIESKESLIAMLLLGTGGCLLAAAMVIVPLLPILEIVRVSHIMTLALSMAALTNVLGALLILFPVAVFILLLAHRSIWPPIKNLIYAAQRYQVVVC